MRAGAGAVQGRPQRGASSGLPRRGPLGVGPLSSGGGLLDRVLRAGGDAHLDAVVASLDDSERECRDV